MTWESFYLTCFLVGFLLSLVAFLAEAGHIHGGHTGLHLHHGTHAGMPHLHGSHAGVHVHNGAHAGTAHAHGGPEIAKLNLITVTAFLAWFGGTGYLIERYASIWMWFGFALAALAGLAGASVVFWFLAKLIARDRTLDPADYDMIGVLGQVTSSVRPGGTGEMIFTQDGARRAAPIRSDTGSAIERGTEVVVTRYERGIAYVRRWDELAAEVQPAASEPRPSGSGF